MLVCSVLAICPVLPAAGTVVYEETFESADAPAGWNGAGKDKANIIEAAPGAHILEMRGPEHGDHLVTRELPVEQLRGRKVAISAVVKAEDVVKSPEPWHGVKVMLLTVSPKGPEYTGVPNLAGTFGWKDVGTVVDVPADATEAKLFLGLGEAKGTAWFDNVHVALEAERRVRPDVQPALLPPEKLDRRMDLPRLRGVMYGPGGKEVDLRKLAEWKGNHLRWQFYWYDGSLPEKRLDLALYDKWLDATMAEVDRWLPLCRELGIRVLIDLHTPPGGTDAGQMEIFRQKAYQDKFIEAWDKLVQRYKDEPAVWGYDLLNEPAEGKAAAGLMNWRALSEHVARRIREVDAKHAIIVEPGANGGWSNLPYFPPIELPGIVYSVHMYDPLKFTHQGILEGSPEGVNYPGMVDGVYWDKQALKKLLDPVREYQKDYNVPIYIGEFSAPRWAPGDSAANYLRDCIEIFEEYGWDWAYHAFREWHGWNVEVGPDRVDESPSKTQTAREKVLRGGLERNVPTPAAPKTANASQSAPRTALMAPKRFSTPSFR